MYKCNWRPWWSAIHLSENFSTLLFPANLSALQRRKTAINDVRFKRGKKICPVINEAQEHLDCHARGLLCFRWLSESVCLVFLVHLLIYHRPRDTRSSGPTYKFGLDVDEQNGQFRQLKKNFLQIFQFRHLIWRLFIIGWFY